MFWFITARTIVEIFWFDRTFLNDSDIHISNQSIVNNIKSFKKRKGNKYEKRKLSFKWSQYCSCSGGRVWAGHWVQLLLHFNDFISLELLQFSSSNVNQQSETSNEVSPVSSEATEFDMKIKP